MSDTLYPVFYGTRLVTFDVLEATFSSKCHPEFWRRMKNFLLHQGGKFGIGGGWRAVGAQPDLSGFAPEGKSFHQSQLFRSGLYFAAFDLVVVNPGHVHRAPTWSEVPVQGKKLAYDYGIHANVGVPGARGSESWHHQPVELDGWDTWVAKGRPDIDYSYPIAILAPRPTPPQPPVPHCMSQPRPLQQTPGTVLSFKQQSDQPRATVRSISSGMPATAPLPLRHSPLRASTVAPTTRSVSKSARSQARLPSL